MHVDEDVDVWLVAVDDRWREIGVPGLERARLRRELERDVAAALDAGAGLLDLIGTDPTDFADQVATAQGHPIPRREGVPPTPMRIAATALGGAVAGALVVWLGVWPYLNDIAPTLSDAASMWLYYSVGGVIVLLGATGALRLRLGRIGLCRELAPTLIGLVAGCLVGLAPAIAISHALDYPTQPVLVLIEATSLLALAVGGIILARRVATRHRTAVDLA